jgi:hypothetical protein
MAWIYGSVSTGNGTQKLADILSEAAIGISLQTIDAVGTAGTGYAVGDELTLSGGTFTIAAVAEVLTVGGSGEVLTVRVRNAGIYQVAPTSDVATTGGTGSGCELTCTFDNNGWTRLRATNVFGAAQSATVDDGGTGYVVGDTLTLSGGTGHTAARFRVASVSSGVVTAVTVLDPGSYSAPPSSPVATTGGTGSGCELTVVFGADDSNAREIILQSAEDVFVGWLTYESGANFQLEIGGMTGFGSGLAWNDQPGLNQGRSANSDGGHYCPTHQLGMTFWISVNDRRILFVYRASTYYGSGHAGFIDAFATEGEWPYPMYVAGSTHYSATGLGDTSEVGGSIVNPIGRSNTYGSASLRDASGTWRRIRNTQTVSGAGYSIKRDDGVTLPYTTVSLNSTTAPEQQDRFPNTSQGLNVSAQGAFNPLFGTQHFFRIFPTPNSGDPLFLRIPVTIVWNAEHLYGQIAGAFAMNGAALLVPENRLREDSRRFTVFGMALTSADDRAMWCVEEV